MVARNYNEFFANLVHIAWTFWRATDKNESVQILLLMFMTVMITKQHIEKITFVKTSKHVKKTPYLHLSSVSIFS